ncbi:DciA family protein [Candidatus Similichlamydia epinepheli]|uniref:DciA family protein n=1 Tax=Candidatus Similichlamydia epinepheli TaxID=1903953 RepID=UPI000D3AD9F5|nr:DciA family protein [Candidatus Similichlamydia epinepheli]
MCEGQEPIKEDNKFKICLRLYLRSLQRHCRQRNVALEISDVWLKVVGANLFARSRILSYSSGVLYVGVKDFVAFQECTLFSEKYIHEIESFAPHLEVKNIVVRMERGLSE